MLIETMVCYCDQSNYGRNNFRYEVIRLIQGKTLCKALPAYHDYNASFSWKGEVQPKDLKTQKFRRD